MKMRVFLILVGYAIFSIGEMSATDHGDWNNTFYWKKTIADPQPGGINGSGIVHGYGVVWGAQDRVDDGFGVLSCATYYFYLGDDKTPCRSWVGCFYTADNGTKKYGDGNQKKIPIMWHGIMNGANNIYQIPFMFNDWHGCVPYEYTDPINIIYVDKIWYDTSYGGWKITLKIKKGTIVSCFYFFTYMDFGIVMSKDKDFKKQDGIVSLLQKKDAPAKFWINDLPYSEEDGKQGGKNKAGKEGTLLYLDGYLTLVPLPPVGTYNGKFIKD